MGFGERLKSARKSHGYSGVELGKIGGVERSAQFMYENNQTKPTVEYLLNVVSAGLDLGYLLYGNQTKVELGVCTIQEKLIPEIYRIVDFCCVDEGGSSLSAETKSSFFKDVCKLVSDEPSVVKDVRVWRQRSGQIFQNNYR